MDLGILLTIAGGLILAWLLLLAVIWMFRPRGVALAELIRLVPDVLRLIRSLLTDREVPRGVRLALFGLLLWLVSPIDLVPEFLPVIGPLDDIVVAVLVLRYTRRRLGDEELRRRWPGTEAGFELLRTVLG